MGIELPAGSAAAIRRRELYLWVAACLFANQALQLVDTSSLRSFATSLAEQNYLLWFAVYAAIFRLRRVDGDVAASRLDCAAALLLGIAILCASFVPHRFGIGLLAAGIAGYMLRHHGGDRNLKAAGGVMLAVSAQMVWAPLIFQLFTPELLRADATLIGAILEWLRPDIIWRGGTTFTGPAGHSVTLVGACSSFNNVSSALLGCVAMTMLVRTEWRRGDFVTIVVVCVAMILVNSFRICISAWSPELHAFWHDGFGAQILAMGQTLIILAIAWQGAARKGEA